MKSLRTFILLSSLLCCNLLIKAQDLSFKVTIITADTVQPIIMKVQVSGSRMLMEPLNMGTPGSMKIMVDNAQNKQYMLMNMNGQKMAMPVDMKSLEKAPEAYSEPKLTITQETKVINNHKCTKVLTESETQKGIFWVSPDVGMDYAEFYKILSAWKSQNNMVRIPELKSVKGFPIEIVSTDKKKNETTTIKISDISHVKVDPKLFSMDGYQMMDPPKDTH